VPRTRAHGVIALGVALAVAGVAGVVPLAWMQGARSLPPVNDITTDTVNPPAFVAILPLRANATVPAIYAGKASADLQKQGYPDIAPMVVGEKTFVSVGGPPPENAVAGTAAATTNARHTHRQRWPNRFSFMTRILRAMLFRRDPHLLRRTSRCRKQSTRWSLTIPTACMCA